MTTDERERLDQMATAVGGTREGVLIMLEAGMISDTFGNRDLEANASERKPDRTEDVMKYSHLIEEVAKAIYHADPEEGDWGEEAEGNRETYYRYAVAAVLAVSSELRSGMEDE